ncbi:MAG: hypothetical protein QOJ66_3023 [Ilumatobacteraceae bacterium]
MTRRSDAQLRDLFWRRATYPPGVASTSTALRRTRTRPRYAALGGLRLHRYLTVGVFGVALAIGAYTIKTHPAQYASSGTVVFVAPDTIAQREARNDKFVDHASQSVLARFSSLTVVGDIFSRTYQSWGKRMALEQQGLRGRLFVTTRTDVSSDTPDHGPVIVFEVLAADPLAARDGVRLVIDDLQQELDRWQHGADPTLSVTDTTIAAPAPGVLASGSRSRSAAGFVVFAALLAWLVGQIDLRRRSRRLHFS